MATRLRTLNTMVHSTLSSNIPPSLTSDIWSSGGSNSDSYLSYTMHIISKGLKLESYSLGALLLRDLPHNQQTISEVWLRVCADTLGIDSDHFQPVISTDGASHMVAADCCAGGWFWMWCMCHILHLAVQAGWQTIQGETDFMPRMKKIVTHMHQSPSEWAELKNCQVAVLTANAP